MQTLIIAGNVGKDAVLRRTGNGDPVLGFSLAVENGKDAQGNRRDSTWYDCSIFGKRAESLSSYITKGSKLALTGRPTVRVHDGKAYLGISVQELTFMGGGGDREAAPRDEPQGDGYNAGGRSGSMEDEIPW